MKPDRYTIRTLDEICFYLKKYKDREEEWQADFYSLNDEHLCSFENDEETMERLQTLDDTYAMVTEQMDIAMMMGREFDV